MDGIEPILIGRVDTASEAKRRLFDRSEPEDVILDTLLTHFRSHQRLSRGIDFFGQLVTVHAPAAISLAALLRLTGRVEQAVSLLQTATGDLPDSARLRLELSECFMEGGNGEGAVAAAMEACAVRRRRGRRTETEDAHTPCSCSRNENLVCCRFRSLPPFPPPPHTPTRADQPDVPHRLARPRPRPRLRRRARPRARRP